MSALIHSMRFIVKHGFRHIDNLSGRLITKELDSELLSEYEMTTEEDKENRIIIKSGRGGKEINPVMMDSFTASAYCSIYDALNEVNREKFAAILPVTRAVNFMWKLFNKSKAA